MRFVGGLLFLLGGAGTAYCLHAAFSRRRPVDVAFAIAAPLCLALALVGALLVFVPGFFG